MGNDATTDDPQRNKERTDRLVPQDHEGYAAELPEADGVWQLRRPCLGRGRDDRQEPRRLLVRRDRLLRRKLGQGLAQPLHRRSDPGGPRDPIIAGRRDQPNGCLRQVGVIS